MKLFAIYPQEPELAVFEKMPPLGMLWVAAALRRAGHDVVFVDQQVDGRDPAKLAEEIEPSLALLGGTSHSRFASFAIARRIKSVSPETVIVYGGPHASFTAEDTLENIPEIDLIVRGEGEETAVEIANWAQEGRRPERLPAIPGVSWRDVGGVRHSEPRRPIQDLDALGPPARDFVPMDRYEMRMDYIGVAGASIMTARGCPAACSFCSASAMFGKSYRMRSPARVVDEIESLLGSHGVAGIKIFDSTFTLNRRHVEGFCAEIKRRGLRFPWECEIRVGSVDQRLLALMQECGCYYVDVGIESGSQRVLDACVTKGIRLADAESLLVWTRSLGLLTKVFFTLGHPGETLREAKETNGFYWRHRRSVRLAAYQAGIKIYPGTPVHAYAERHGLLPSGFRWSAPFVNTLNRRLYRSTDNVPLLTQPGLGIEDLRRLRQQFILMRLSSPRFVWEKVRSILRAGTLSSYLRILARGARFRTRRCAPTAPPQLPRRGPSSERAPSPGP